MNASDALANEDMVVLIYSHKERQISIENGDPCSVEEAKELFDRALVLDCNMAMTRLCCHNYDMDAAEESYKQEEENR